MKKAVLITGAALALLLVASIGALAFVGQKAGSSTPFERGAYHEQIEEIFDSGSYADLEALRAETGRPMMPWVTDEESFQQMKEHHEQMEELCDGNCPMMNGGAHGLGMAGRGMMGHGMMGHGMMGHGMMGHGMDGGEGARTCPMMSDDS